MVPVPPCDPPSKLASPRVLYNWVTSRLRRPAWWSTSEQRREQHGKIYDAEYYKFIEFSATWSREAMADSIVRDLAPRNALDVGCGTGTLLEALSSRDVNVTGLEFSDAALALCHERGLSVRKFDILRDRLPDDLRSRDLVLSFEVAEHLPARRADRFLDILSAASDTVVLSAATPGQGGTDHLNEQPHEYWIQKMARRRYTMDWKVTLRWRSEWCERTANWYHANVMVFRRSRPAEAA